MPSQAINANFLTENEKQVIIRPLAPHSIPSHWGQIEPHLQRALDQIPSGLETRDLLERFLRLEMQLWDIDGRAAGVTQVCTLPQFNMLIVLYLAGDDMETWLPHYMDAIADFAKERECRYVETFGRPGWERLFKPKGGQKIYSVMRFKVDGWTKLANTD